MSTIGALSLLLFNVVAGQDAPEVDPVTAAIAKVRSLDPDKREQGLKELGSLFVDSPLPATAQAAAINVLDDPDRLLRAQAVWLLVRRGTLNQELLTALEKRLLKYSDAWVRQQIALEFGQQWRKAKAAAPLLEPALKD